MDFHQFHRNANTYVYRVITGDYYLYLMAWKYFKTNGKDPTHIVWLFQYLAVRSKILKNNQFINDVFTLKSKEMQNNQIVRKLL